MTVVALDTYEVAKELRAAGFSEAQAEAVTRAVRRAQDIDLSNLSSKSDLEALRVAVKADLDTHRVATKADLDAHRAAAKADIDAHRAATKADLDGLRHEIGLLRAETGSKLDAQRIDILKWVFGMVGVQTVVILGAMAGLLRLFPR